MKFIEKSEEGNIVEIDRNATKNVYKEIWNRIMDRFNADGWSSEEKDGLIVVSHKEVEEPEIYKSYFEALENWKGDVQRELEQGIVDYKHISDYKILGLYDMIGNESKNIDQKQETQILPKEYIDKGGKTTSTKEDLINNSDKEK